MRAIALGLRWFWLNCRLILFCLKIAFWCRLSIIVTRWQIRFARWSGLYEAPLFAFIFLFFLAGCAHQPPLPVMAVASPHAEVDHSLSEARLSQQAAATQVAAIAGAVTDPATKQAVLNLQSTINALGLKLETATGRLAWYEAQFDLVAADREAWKVKDSKDFAARVAAERERDALVWVFSLASGMAALSTFSPALKVFQMPWQLFALAGVFVAGFALGFSVGRWCLHFLAQFTPHLPF